MKERLDIVKELLNNPEKLSFMAIELSQYDWDYDWKKETLTAKALNQIFMTYHKNNYDLLSRWADFIELRDDIEYENKNVHKIIGILSTPEIYWILSEKEFIDILK